MGARPASPGAGLGDHQIVTPDGTVFIDEPDPDSTPNSTQRITAYLPDGTARTVWRASDTGAINSSPGEPMLAGPP